MIKLEEPYMPKHLYMIKGHAFDSHNHPLEALVQAIDVQTGEVLAYDTSDPTSGSFEIILTEGADCDFSIFPKDLKHAYYSTLLPLSAMERSERKFLDVELGDLREKPSMMLGELVIEAGGERLPDDLNISLNRLAYLLTENPEVKVEVGGFMRGYREDSIMVDPELTEVRYDTVQLTQVVEILDSVMTSQSLLRIDSLISLANDSLENRNIDSLKRSVLSYKPVIRYDTIIREEVVTTYHNDRTLSYARHYVDALIEKGIDQKRLQVAGYREEVWEEIVFDPEQEGTQYKLAVRFF
jgi:hypothetical protein